MVASYIGSAMVASCFVNNDYSLLRAKWLGWRDDLPGEEFLAHARNYPRPLPAAAPYALHAERFSAPRLPVGEYRGVEPCYRPV